MEWQLKYIEILVKKFNLLSNIKNNNVVLNEDVNLIIKELNNITEIKQFILKIYIVKKTIKSTTFHLVAKTDKFFQLDILNNNSKNRKIEINFKYIEQKEYDNLDYRTSKPSSFGYDIWKYSVKQNLLDLFSNQITWSNDVEELKRDLESIEINYDNFFDDKIIEYISNVYNKSYTLYDYDEKEYLYILENDEYVYHLYFIRDDCSADECYKNVIIKKYGSIDEFLQTIPECIFHRYYSNSESLIYDNFKYMVEMDYIYELNC